MFHELNVQENKLKCINAFIIKCDNIMYQFKYDVTINDGR